MSTKDKLIQHLELQNFPSPIIRAFEKVERQDFVPSNQGKNAYYDNALPIGHKQTISQPSTIAIMLSMLDLKLGQKVLEIGSGSGYVLALLSEIVGEKGEVHGIERLLELAEQSIKNLKISGYNDIHVHCQDGTKPTPNSETYDRILISAGSEKYPPKSLLNQLKPNGILVIPLGPSGGYQRTMTAIQRKQNQFKTINEKPGFGFVPLVED